MLPSGTGSPPTLITFPPSLDSELARFLLVHYRVPHVERSHALVFSSFVTLWHGWTPVFPLLYGQGFAVTGPRALVERYEPLSPAERRLQPEAGADRSQVEEDWTLFNGSLAFATAVFAYYHLLPHRELMLEPLTRGTPEFERRTVAQAYPVFAGLLRLLLRLTAGRAQEGLDGVRRIFAAVEGRLAGGRRHLVGDRLTLSDVAFAVGAAPVLLPSSYGGAVPALADMPPVVQHAVAEMRATAAGAFAMRIYDKHRLA
jgi:glutathione S-transferase